MQYRGGLRDRLIFLYLRLKGLVCNVGFRALQFTRGLVPSASGERFRATEDTLARTTALF